MGLPTPRVRDAIRLLLGYAEWILIPIPSQVSA
jgi:hypothetical protein